MSPSVVPVRRSGNIRSTQRKVPRGRDDEERLTADIIELARQDGRYGYRKVVELLRRGRLRQTPCRILSRYISFTAEKPCAITIVGTFPELWSGR